MYMFLINCYFICIIIICWVFKEKYNKLNRREIIKLVINRSKVVLLIIKCSRMVIFVVYS